jgi:hypothetical protein
MVIPPVVKVADPVNCWIPFWKAIAEDPKVNVLKRGDVVTKPPFPNGVSKRGPAIESSI